MVSLRRESGIHRDLGLSPEADRHVRDKAREAEDNKERADRRRRLRPKRARIIKHARALAKALEAYPLDRHIDYTEASRLQQTYTSVENLVEWLAKAPTHAQSIREASHQFKTDTAQQLEPETAGHILRAMGIDVGGRPAH